MRILITKEFSSDNQYSSPISITESSYFIITGTWVGKITLQIQLASDFIDLKSFSSNVEFFIPVNGIYRFCVKRGNYTSGTMTCVIVTGLDSKKIGSEYSGNYAEFQSDGSLFFVGNSTIYEDLRVPMTATKTGGSKDPGFAVVLTDGSGSQGVFSYLFDASSEEELYFACQVPHDYKQGTNLSPHVHWMPVSNGTSGHKVSWGLEYSWSNISGIYSNTQIIYTNTHYPADAALVAKTHYMSSFAEITGTGKTISSMLICRIFRNATSATDDTYTADAGLLEFDFHYEVDSLGSRLIGTK